MAKKRKRIDKKIRNKLLVDAMHRCCLCPQHEDITDIHHIVPINEDGPDTEENLMVVCPTCHVKIHRIRTMYNIEQLKMYKDRWVSLCAKGLTLEERLKEAPGIEQPELKTAHILFMDIVGYSKLRANQQLGTIEQLNQIVMGTSFIGYRAKERRLILPTGDGMAIAFLENPESPLLTACQIATKSKGVQIPLRMGIHTGPVYLVEDISKQPNLVGGGINLANRVMDCGDAGHILASKVVAEALSEVKEEYERLFHYLGKFEVKHGVVIEIYNVYDKDVGNPYVPQRRPIISKR